MTFLYLEILRFLQVDDKEVVLPDDVQGVMCTNLQSYMGGVDLWSNSGGKGNKASIQKYIRDHNKVY